MGVPRVSRSFYLLVLVIALVVAVVLVAAARGLRSGTRRLSRFGERFVPVPIAKLSAVVVVAVLLTFIVNGAVYSRVF